MLIEWKDSYATGLAAIDYEHRQLIDLINRLHADMMATDAFDEAVARFADLFNAISAHFALEEREMRTAGYDRFAAHKTDHEALLDQLRDMMDAYEEDPGAHSPDALGAALDGWFSDHFRVHDSRLHRKLG